MPDTISIESAARNGLGSYTKIIDLRPISAFNGWTLRGEERGGHLPGAIAIPVRWVQSEFGWELVAGFEEKGISPADKILLYGYGHESSLRFGDRLEALGYDQVSVLEGGFAEWAATEGLEVVTLPRFRELVYPDWLAGVLAGSDVFEASHSKPFVFHVNCGGPEDYARGHIPGAFHLDTHTLESPEDGNRRCPRELEVALLAKGITLDTPVVLYGNDLARDIRDHGPERGAGQVAATRAAAILKYAGVSDVRLLDGGLNAWQSEGHPVQVEERQPRSAESFGAKIPAKSSVFIDYDEVVELLDNPQGVLVSIRSRPEHEGETSGYSYIDAIGDIPGAVWGNSGSDAYHMENYRNIDNTMRAFNEIEANWCRAGITTDKTVAFYCGTGWRASETWFYAHLLGWDDVSVYDGGWSEWSRINGPSL